MNNNLTIFDQTERRKLQGIEAVYQHANTHWKVAAVEQLQQVIQSKDRFTSDDILMPLEQRGITTKDTRAIAAILLAAKRVGQIRATNIFVKCRRKSRHNAPVMVWQVVRR